MELTCICWVYVGKKKKKSESSEADRLSLGRLWYFSAILWPSLHLHGLLFTQDVHPDFVQTKAGLDL